ncbi:MAG: hypothetical protein HFF23_10600 [Oscillospiraceae bacterium]|nr:hypothetical protein [Oscillospiraceae bacterium]
MVEPLINAYNLLLAIQSVIPSPFVALFNLMLGLFAVSVIIKLLLSIR